MPSLWTMRPSTIVSTERMLRIWLSGVVKQSRSSPNVYYEVGHAHAVGKKPVLVRRRGSVLHFDLAAHNVKEYGSLDELRAILRSRLVTI